MQHAKTSPCPFTVPFSAASGPAPFEQRWLGVEGSGLETITKGLEPLVPLPADQRRAFTAKAREAPDADEQYAAAIRAKNVAQEAVLWYLICRWTHDRRNYYGVEGWPINEWIRDETLASWERILTVLGYQVTRRDYMLIVTMPRASSQ